MEWNDEMLNKWERINLENGNSIYIRERKYENQEKEIHEKVPMQECKSVIKVIKSSKQTLGKTTFILVDTNNRFLGFCEIDIRDGEAGLTSRDVNEYKQMDLPQELEHIREEIQSNSDALFVNELIQKKGIGTQLLIIGFNYLVRKGIDTVSVAPSLASRGFYEKTGAKAEYAGFVYTNLQEVIQRLSTRNKDENENIK